MHPKSSRDMPGPDPRKHTDREAREAVVIMPDKTNDWDRDRVHGEGETIGIESDLDNLATAETNAGIEMDGEGAEEDDDNAYQNSDDALPDDEEEAAIARHPTREGRFDET
jgi:hypothetical protein